MSSALASAVLAFTMTGSGIRRNETRATRDSRRRHYPRSGRQPPLTLAGNRRLSSSSFRSVRIRSAARSGRRIRPRSRTWVDTRARCSNETRHRISRTAPPVSGRPSGLALRI
eukprot:30957-Pelagococcus_subviridis.AAC.67